MPFARWKGGTLILQVPLTKQHVKSIVLQILFISVLLKIALLSWLLF